jgi:uncharacterized membrane protein (UPF0127 family)
MRIMRRSVLLLAVALLGSGSAWADSKPQPAAMPASKPVTVPSAAVSTPPAQPSAIALNSGEPDETHAQPELAKEALVIVSHDGQRHLFHVEMAKTMDQQMVGLMWRKTVPADGGMLFDWGYPRESDMWMKNTIAPLDMLFIDQNGVIRHIAEDTVPQSLAEISSGGPIYAALELAAGTAERLDIQVGDKIEQRIFMRSHP